MRLAMTALLIASSVLAAGEAPILVARPVQLFTGAVLPADLPFEAKPFAHETGFKIWWLVQGADLIAFDEQSVVMTTMKSADGKDIATTRSGKPTWKMDSFPRISEDGKYAVFTIECSADVFGQSERVAMAGSVVAITGNDRKEVELAFDPSKPSNGDAGPLKVAFGAKGMGFSNVSDAYAIKVSGLLATIASIQVLDGEAKLEPQGWSGSGDDRIYSFAKPKHAAPRLKLAYWGTSGRIKVEFRR